MMNISKDELIAVLSQFNPWWRQEAMVDLPEWHRVAFTELFTWITQPPVSRAVLLSGARQVGKTTLLLQAIDKLLKQGEPAANILYVTFDHPIIKLAGIDAALAAWRAREPKVYGLEFLFLDEAQFSSRIGTWIKHQVDFNKDCRIVFTGSAMPLIYKEQESGVGRWHTIQLTTLSFSEYLRLKKAPVDMDILLHDKFKQLESSIANLPKQEAKTELYRTYESSINALLKQKNKYLTKWLFMDLAATLPKLPELKSLTELFTWSSQEFQKTSELAVPYVGYFHEYLLRGGFPQTATIESINQAQRLVREDIVDKVLKRDMTALFNVRKILELEQLFLYLCMHDGGLLDMQKLRENLQVTRPTAKEFIELLIASHLIYKLQPFGYGKEVLRAKFKIYLADAAIAPAVLLKGKSLLDDVKALGIAVENTVFKHLFAHCQTQNVRLTYWQNVKHEEIDLIAETNNQIIPFEVKYRSNYNLNKDLKGLLEFCKKKSLERAYLITKSIDDFGVLEIPNSSTRIMRIPGALFCYWIGEAALSPDEWLTEQSASQIN